MSSRIREINEISRPLEEETYLNNTSNLPRINAIGEVTEQLHSGSITIDELYLLLNNENFSDILRSGLVTDLLDLTMLESIFVAYQSSIPSTLKTAVDTLSKRLEIPPVTTYQLLVLENTPDDMRIYMSEEVDQKNEILFYRTHQEIENNLQIAVLDIFSYLEGNSALCPEKISQYLKAARRNMIDLNLKLNKESFSRMRTFYYNDRGINGPSGLYSAAFPTLDILTIPSYQNNSIPSLELLPKKLREEHNYLTVSDIRRAQDYKEEGLTLAHKNGIEAQEVRKLILEFLKSFRKMHHGSIKKYLPEVAIGADRGTGGVEGQSPDLTMSLIKERLRLVKESLNEK